MIFKSMTEGTQPKKVQTPSQHIIPQLRPVAEVHNTYHVYVIFFLPDAKCGIVITITPEIYLPIIHR